jgi:hypothetical protein
VQEPKFIKAGCHLGTFITAIVNTEAEQANIQALQGNLDSALTRVNVSSAFILAYSFWPLTNFLLQKIIKHSHGKDKILWASLKRIYEAQDLEDELIREQKTNQAPLA